MSGSTAQATIGPKDSRALVPGEAARYPRGPDVSVMVVAVT